MFTRGAVIALDPGTIDVGRIANTLQVRDTTFVVRNTGYASDSLTLTIDPVNVVPDTAIAVFPASFVVAAHDSQKVTFRIRPKLLMPQYYTAGITVVPKAGTGQTALTKVFDFEIATFSGMLDPSGFPGEFSLDQNYPNPFNPSTTIRYGLANRSHVTLRVFNTLGQQVAQLVHGEVEAGYHQVQFDGNGLSSGVYLYRLQAGDFVTTKRLLFLR